MESKQQVVPMDLGTPQSIPMDLGTPPDKPHLAASHPLLTTQNLQSLLQDVLAVSQKVPQGQTETRRVKLQLDVEMQVERTSSSSSSGKVNAIVAMDTSTETKPSHSSSQPRAGAEVKAEANVDAKRAGAGGAEANAEGAEANWATLAYFNNFDLLESERRSYNFFLEHSIQWPINRLHPYIRRIFLPGTRYSQICKLQITPKRFVLGNCPSYANTVSIEVPLDPVVTRSKGLCFNTPIRLEYEFQTWHTEEKLEQGKLPSQMFPQRPQTFQTKFGRLPILTRSLKDVLSNQLSSQGRFQAGQDLLDHGGYFLGTSNVSSGHGSARVQERHVKTQDFRAFNKSLVVQDKHTGNMVASCLSHPCPGQTSSYAWVDNFVVRSSSNRGFNLLIRQPKKKSSQQLEQKRKKADKTVDAVQQMPILLVLRALGFMSYEEMKQALGFNLWEKLFDSIEEDQRNQYPQTIQNADQALLILIRQHKLTQALERYVPNPDAQLETKRIEKILHTARNVLIYRVLGHCPLPAQKARYLGYMILRLILEEQKPPDKQYDIVESLANRRLAMSGELMLVLWTNVLEKCWRMTMLRMDERIKTQKTLPNLDLDGQSDWLTDEIQKYINTGIWPCVPYPDRTRENIVEVVKRDNPTCATKSLVSISVSAHTKSPNWRMAQVETSFFGLRDPHSTPEKEKIGRVTEPAIYTRVTGDLGLTPQTPDGANAPSLKPAVPLAPGLSRLLESKWIVNEDQKMAGSGGLAAGQPPSWEIAIDGIFLLDQKVEQPLAYQREMYALRQQGQLPWSVGIWLEEPTHTVWIETRYGRQKKPFWVCDSKGPLVVQQVQTLQQMLKTCPPGEWWNQFQKRGWIDWLDAMEIESPGVRLVLSPFSRAYIPHPHATHAAFVPDEILGPTGAIMGEIGHQPGPRVAFSHHHLPQIISLPNFGYWNSQRVEMMVTRTLYRPLQSTTFADVTGHNWLPTQGPPCTVLVMDMKGFGIEDAIQLNQTALQRGLLAKDVHKSICARIRTVPSRVGEGVQSHLRLENPLLSEGGCELIGEHEVEQAKFCQLPKTKQCTCGVENCDSSSLYCSPFKTTGLAPVNTRMEQGQVIAGIVMVLHMPDGRFRKVNQSLVYSFSRPGIIERIWVDIHNNEDILVHFSIVLEFPTRIGDKFVGGCHAQKGINDMSWPSYLMPMTEGRPGTLMDGIVPTVIIHPCAFPGRMTVGQLVSMLQNVGILSEPDEAFLSSGNNFGEFNLSKVSETLTKHGLHPKGRWAMRDAITGELLTCTVFMGVTRYSALPHLVEQKAHARSKDGGRRQVGSLQPVKGKKKNGGLRFGELERALLIAQGLSNQAMCWLSNHAGPFIMDVCNRCGLMAVTRTDDGQQFCRVCRDNEQLVRVKTTGAFKSTLQLLMASGIHPRVFTTVRVPGELQSVDDYTEQLENSLAGGSGADAPGASAPVPPDRPGGFAPVPPDGPNGPSQKRGRRRRTSHAGSGGQRGSAAPSSAGPQGLASLFEEMYKMND